MNSEINIPKIQFSAKTREENGVFETWRESIIPLMDSVPLEGDPNREKNSLEVTSYLMNDVVLTHTKFDKQLCMRNSNWVRKNDDADHFVIQYLMEGEHWHLNGSENKFFKVGSFHIIDLSKEFYSKTEYTDVLSLIVPREVMKKYVPEVEKLSRVVLPAGSARANILSHALFGAMGSLNHIRASEANSFSNEILSLAADFFNPELRRLSPEMEQAIFGAMDSFMDQQIANPDLGVDLLCKKFALSRATLYRLYKPLGGVSHVVRQKRLQRAFLEITRTGGSKRKIIDVAFDWGFDNSTTFSRAFKKTYGILPSEAQSYSEVNFAKEAQNNPSYLNSNLVQMKSWFQL